MSAKVLRQELTWALKRHKGGQCDWNGVGEREGQVQVIPGQAVQGPAERRNRNRCLELGYGIPHFLSEGKPSGLGLLGDNPDSHQGLRVSRLAAMGAHVF